MIWFACLWYIGEKNEDKREAEEATRTCA